MGYSPKCCIKSTAELKSILIALNSGILKWGSLTNFNIILYSNHMV